jgi:hypothetical protein
MDPRLLEKIQKVLTLSREGIEGEAQAAAAILQKMLTEHNLSIADLEKKGAKAEAVSEKGHDLGKAAFTWKLDLAEAVAEHFFCASIVDRRRKTVSFVGRPDNVDSLQMLYAWLIGQVQAIAREERTKHHEQTGEHVDPLRWQVNFGVGAVRRLRVRLEEEKQRHQDEMARNSMGDVVALVCTRASENSDYLEKKYGYRTDGKETERDRKWRKEWEAEQAARKRQQEDWKARDPEGYAAHQKRLKEAEEAEERAWQRKQRRRANYIPRERERAYNPERARQEEQAYQARKAGLSAADRINLKPFLEGKVPADASKQVRGKKS